MDAHPYVPPILRAEAESDPLARGPWYRTIAPAYLGIFVWAPFFDALWVDDLTRFPLPWLIATAVLASFLCFGLFFYVPAMRGHETGRTLGVLAASTFGNVGSEWITGVAVGLANIFWYAIAIDYAAGATLLGLKSCGLIDPASLSDWDLGFLTVKSPVYLSTALFWIYITGTSYLWKITGVIAALMKVYAPIALVLLTAIALWLLPEVSFFRVHDVGRAGLLYGPRVRGSVVQVMTGFFALAGLASADWGARARNRRELVLGGLTGIVFAASWMATMSLIVVAGTAARVSFQGDRLVPGVDDPFRLTFRWAVYHGIGGIPGGIVFILFGLAALAPACYSMWAYGQRLSTHWPRLGQAGWTWLGGAIALGLGALSFANHPAWIFCATGDVFGPALGAIVCDCAWRKGAPAVLRSGINKAGLISWAAGVLIAFLLELLALFSPELSPWWKTTSIAGFAASFVCYWSLAGLGREPADVPI